MSLHRPVLPERRIVTSEETQMVRSALTPADDARAQDEAVVQFIRACKGNTAQVAMPVLPPPLLSRHYPPTHPHWQGNSRIHVARFRPGTIICEASRFLASFSGARAGIQTFGQHSGVAVEGAARQTGSMPGVHRRISVALHARCGTRQDRAAGDSRDLRCGFDQNVALRS